MMVIIIIICLQVFQGVPSLQESLSIQEVHFFLGHQVDQDLLWFLPCLTGQLGLAHLVVQGVQNGPAHLMGLSLQKDPSYKRPMIMYDIQRD